MPGEGEREPWSDSQESRRPCQPYPLPGERPEDPPTAHCDQNGPLLGTCVQLVSISDMLYMCVNVYVCMHEFIGGEA